jgi:geranylgeranyl diphosphate synthase type II
MDISSYLDASAAKIEKTLDTLVPVSTSRHRQLYEAARYSLLGPGKRIRPILVLAVCEMTGGNPEHALYPAAAIEMIHTYSLIHDDLPCMDNDDFRRGKPTLHKAFPESHALLAGDFLLTQAFNVLSKAPTLSPELKIELIDLLGKAAGGDGMIGGQLQDIESGLHQQNKTSLDELHKAKTGALIEASVHFGALLGKASAEERKILQHSARNMGLAFQIVDDVLDVTENGKKRASDQVNGKQTYATLMGIEQAKTEAEQLHQNALSELRKLPYDTSLFAGLVTYIITRKK